MKIERLTPRTEPLWREFAARHEQALFYVSLEFRDLLVRILGAAPHYLIALENGRVRGVLPCFAATHATLGTVLNSLPYYGSNGGCLTDGDPAVAQALVAAYLVLERDLGCVASTVISSPFDTSVAHYEEQLGNVLRDSRTGQITPLPKAGDGLEDRLFALYDETARRNVRKARKSGVSWTVEDDEEAYRFLHATHEQNIRSVGGRPKAWSFFEEARRYVPPAMRRLYVAYREAERLAALLVFRFARTVEYYTPAVLPAARPLQPLALLVHEAMREAATDGFSHWNWGGTWHSQIGVYRFKRKWGAKDMPYHYFTRISDRSIFARTPEDLLAAFPGFFVMPFDQVAVARTGRAVIQ